MAKTSPTAPPNNEFWPLAVDNADVQQLLDNIKRDSRPRTLPATLPGISPDSPPQRFASWVPIAVNAAVARVLLQYNSVNRKLSPAKVVQLAEAILRGAWMFNGKSSILPCSNQDILDMQHTLHAIIRADQLAKEQQIEIAPMLVIPIIGLDPAAFASIDGVRPRGTRDTLFVAEKVGQISLRDVPDNECSTALRVMLQYVNMVQNIKPGDPLYLDGLRTAVPNYRAAEMMGYFPQLTESLAFCNEIAAFHARPPVISIAIGGVLHAIISEVQSPTAANNFVRSLITGANLEENSPIYKLREQLLGDRNRKVRAEAIEKLATCIRAWNLVATHRPPPAKDRIKSLVSRHGVPGFPVPLAMQRKRQSALVR
jgi:hypothetical protein